MKILAIFLFLASLLQGEEELSIEAFWLGEIRFAEEMARGFEGEKPALIEADVSLEKSRFINEGDVLWARGPR